MSRRPITVIISERQFKILTKLLIEKRKLLNEQDLLIERNKEILTERINWVENIDTSIVFELRQGGEPPLDGYNLVRKRGDQETFVNNSDGDTIYRKISDKESKAGTPSKYYRRGKKSGGEMVVRGSDHWTYYIIPNYTFDYKDLFGNTLKKTRHLIFGTQDKIQGNMRYLLKLDSSYKNLVNPEDVRKRIIPPSLGAAKTIEGKFEFTRGGEHYIIMDKYFLGLFEKKYLWGQCNEDKFLDRIMRIRN